jgi:hypothetical protein
VEELRIKSKKSLGDDWTTVLGFVCISVGALLGAYVLASLF